jgi:hypothetical protein
MVRAGAYLRFEFSSGEDLRKALGLIMNHMSWNGLPGKNTLDYLSLLSDAKNVLQILLLANYVSWVGQMYLGPKQQ